MSVSAIQGSTYSGYISPFEKRGSSVAENAAGNRNTGPDTVSLSQDALALAYGQNAEEADAQEDGLLFKDRLASEENSVQNKPRENLSGVAGKSLFSMLLESLFLAELDENAASGEAVNAGNEQDSEAGISQQQSPKAKGGSPLADGEKATEIKKVLADIGKGKADLSDIPKAMAVNGGGAGAMKSVADKTQGNASATTGNGEKEYILSA